MPLLQERIINMKKILLMILVSVVVGCSSPQPHFYQPVPVQNTEITYPKVKGTILLTPLILPAEASRPQITTIGQNNYDLTIDEFNRWGATPSKLFQHVINQNLSRYMPNASIENQTPVRKNYKYVVSIEINAMIGKLKQDAMLNASYFIRNRNGNVVKSGKLNESVAITGGYDDYVLAQSHLLGALSAQIAADLSRL